MLALAIVGNKEDFKEYEKVEENKARDLAKELKALFMKTSAIRFPVVTTFFILYFPNISSIYLTTS